MTHKSAKNGSARLQLPLASRFQGQAKRVLQTIECCKRKQSLA
jgi:hypothetical protein